MGLGEDNLRQVVFTRAAAHIARLGVGVSGINGLLRVVVVRSLCRHCAIVQMWDCLGVCLQIRGNQELRETGVIFSQRWLGGYIKRIDGVSRSFNGKSRDPDIKEKRVTT